MGQRSGFFLFFLMQAGFTFSQLAVFKGEDGKQGLKDKNGSVIIEPVYLSVTHCTEEIFISDSTSRKGGGFWFVYTYQDGIDKAGCFNEKGTPLTPVKYNGINCFNDGMARVGLDNKYGFIDTTGKEVVPLKYDEASSFYRERASIALNKGKRTVIDDRTDKSVKETVRKYGVINTGGKQIVPVKYEQVVLFQNTEIAVKRNGKYGLLDKKGKKLLPVMYEDISYFSEGLCAVKLDGQWGFANRENELIIPCQFYDVDVFLRGFKNGKVYVYKTEYRAKGYYIDKSGNRLEE